MFALPLLPKVNQVPHVPLITKIHLLPNYVREHPLI